MKRPVSYQELVKHTSEDISHKELSTEVSETFDFFDPLHRLKPLRSAPRKISNIKASELDEFDKWLKKDEANKEAKSDFSNIDKKSRPEKLISENDQVAFGDAVPTYRKITFSLVPTEFKPHYEIEETFMACTTIEELLLIRKNYIYYDSCTSPHPFVSFIEPVPQVETHPELSEGVNYSFVQGVLQFDNVNLKIIPIHRFYSDMQFVVESMYKTSNKSFCYLRLKMLLMKFNIHLQCNVDREQYHQKIQSRKDFYNITKVDNHIHLNACMNQKHLQKFIKAKIRNAGHTIVFEKGGEQIKLLDIMTNLGISASTFTVDVVESYNMNKLERYTNKLKPINQVSIKDIFLEHDNQINGVFFAEVVKEVIQNIDKEKYVLAEYRIPIDGASMNSWQVTAVWLSTNKIKSPRVRWVIQIAKEYTLLKSQGIIKNFTEMLQNIFVPVVEATLHPENFPEISDFLANTVAFDIANNEDNNEKIRSYSNFKLVPPEEWNCDEEPPYSYWSYYIYANLTALNHLRRARGLNTFAYRPHCGEAGSNDHLATSYLLANSINHGIKLDKVPVLQYLFYLAQIGLSISPLSNNKLFVKFLKNPMKKFFYRGLNVALSTDDPLSTHLTREPLMEEYSVAAQTLDLNAVDLCEIARNSVLQSGFPYEQKQQWLGDDFLKCVNDPARSNLSAIRFSFRLETYQEEHSYLKKHANNEDEI